MADLVEVPSNSVPAPSKEADTSELSHVVNELESLCISCEKEGITKILLTKIPYFRDVVIISFKCAHCGYENNEIQSVGPIQDKGVIYTFKAEEWADLSRKIVKSDKCSAKLEEIGLEIVPGKGQVSNLEDILMQIVDDLEILQPERKEDTPELYEKLEVVIKIVRSMRGGFGFPFTITIDDPTGNSWIEPAPSDPPGKLVTKTYARGPELNAQLGYNVENAVPQKEGIPKAMADEIASAEKRIQAPLELPRHLSKFVRTIGEDELDVNKQVHEFETACPNCGKDCTNNMTMVDIPFFKEVILMSILCPHCGYRDSEVKTGGAIPPEGQQIMLEATQPEDLNRSVVRSDSCAIYCPELNFAFQPGSSAGSVSTIEGILEQIKEQTEKSAMRGAQDNDGTGRGDSQDEGKKVQWDKFFRELDEAIAGKRAFTIVFRDPLASSYVERLDQGGTVEDKRLTVESFVRTREEDDELGLLQMKTENYENGPIAEEDEEAASKDEEAAAAAAAAAASAAVGEKEVSGAQPSEK